MDWRIDGLMYVGMRTNGCMYDDGRMDVWMDGCMDDVVCMFGCMCDDGCMYDDVCMDEDACM